MDEFEKFYNKAIKFLSYRPRSEKETRDNLLKKKAPLIIIETIIEKLKNQRFLNDEEFTRWWIEQRTSVNKKSLKVITLELLRKGIDKELTQSIINSSKEEVQNDLDRAKELVQKKIKKYNGLSKQEVYQKLGSYLARRGFDWDTIKGAIDEVVKKGV